MGVPGHIQDQLSVVGQDITFPSPNREVSGYLARPVGGGDRPGVVVVHEAFGLNEHIRDVARRFAAQGYDVLAPQLYPRGGEPAPDDLASVRQVMLSLPDSSAVTDLTAAAEHLRGLDGATGAVGCIGFCSGGRHALLAACSRVPFDAAVDCWGGFVDRASPEELTTTARPTPVVDLVASLGCPLLLAVGAEDTNPSPDVVREVERRARVAGQAVVARVFEEAGHAFFADYRPSYREGPAHALWATALDFLAKHLQR